MNEPSLSSGSDFEAAARHLLRSRIHKFQLFLKTDITNPRFAAQKEFTMNVYRETLKLLRVGSLPGIRICLTHTRDLVNRSKRRKANIMELNDNQNWLSQLNSTIDEKCISFSIVIDGRNTLTKPAALWK